MDLRRAERLVRSAVLATPFQLTNAFTRYEILGRENLEAALERRARSGAGLITISNHQSLFDDPIVLARLLDIRFFTVESKIWWSTPCQSNFHPAGRRPWDRFVRYFSDVSNMVFFERSKKNGGAIRPSDDHAGDLASRADAASLARFAAAASASGLALEPWLRRFVTPGAPEALASLNQPGMVEACARVSTGDWLHLFPEGTRSRTLSFRPPRRGVGKVIYHSEDAEVVPICFYGMHDVLPVQAAVPRPFKRVVVSVGRAVPAARFDSLRRLPPSPEAFQAVVEAAWQSVSALRPATLARYLGPARAAELLRAEAPASFVPDGESVGAPSSAPGRFDAPERRAPTPR